MDRIQFEKLLTDPAELVRLSEWARTAGTDFEDAGPQNHGFAAEPPAHIDRLNSELLAANDRSTLGALRFEEVAPFLEDVHGLNPLDTLEHLEARFKKVPSHQGALLIQSAMNRISASSSLDADQTRAIERAPDLLSETATVNTPPQPANIWYTLYEHSDFRGRASFTSMTPGWGYWRQPSFVQMGMNDIFSSLSFGASSQEVGGAVLLFEHINYGGAYRAYIPTPGKTSFVNYVGNSFNDKTSSALIVRRFARETTPVSIGSLVPSSSIIDIINATPKVRPDGDPTFTWDMWPTGPNGSGWHPNDPGGTFIYVIVPIMVHTPWPFADYHAQVRYWIRLIVDRAGNLQGYVAYWGYWVEGGIISGRVADGLKAAIPGTIGQVNALVARAVLINEGIPSTRIYVRALGAAGGDGPVDRVDLSTDAAATPASATAAKP